MEAELTSAPHCSGALFHTARSFKVLLRSGQWRPSGPATNPSQYCHYPWSKHERTTYPANTGLTHAQRNPHSDERTCSTAWKDLLLAPASNQPRHPTWRYQRLHKHPLPRKFHIGRNKTEYLWLRQALLRCNTLLLEIRCGMCTCPRNDEMK